jgi:hypothetical protein
MNHFVKIARRIATAAAIAVVSTSAFATPINSVDNGSFETPVQNGGYQYLSGTVGSWTFAGTSGVAANNSAFNVANALGSQAAFLQQGTSSISQVFDFKQSLFSVAFSAEARGWGQGANTISVLIDGIALTFSGAATITPGSTTRFVQYTSDFVQLTTGLHTLSFVGTTAAGDTTTFIDGVKVTAVPEPVTLGLFGLGLVALSTGRRKARKQT